MLWLKAWLETRWRLAWAGLVGLLFFSMPLMSMGTHLSPTASQARLATYMVLIAEAAFMATIMLAGSGIHTASTRAGASDKGADRSIVFTLSLPVSRRGAFLTRAALGAVAVLPMVLLCWAFVPLLLHFSPTPVPVRLLAAAIPFQFMAVMLAYSGKLFMECLVGEMTQVWLFGGAVLAGMITAGLRWPPMIRFLDFVSGAAYMTTGQISWFGVGACLAVSCLFVVAAIQVIERREF